MEDSVLTHLYSDLGLVTFPQYRPFGQLWSDGYATGWYLAGFQVVEEMPKASAGDTASFSAGLTRGFADRRFGPHTLPKPALSSRVREKFFAGLATVLDRLTK